MTSFAASIRLPGSLALALALSALGCLPKIGDRCNASLDCSPTGQKICDVTQPNGYCTVFNCEPDNCPDTASCVAFNNNLDVACKDADDGAWPRFERSFCVAPCNQDSDCRTGYLCLAPVARGGVLIDIKNRREKVCLPDVPLAAPPADTAPVPGVCNPGNTGSLPSPYQPNPTGTGGAGGTGGSTTGGASGTGGVAGSGGSSSSAGGSSSSAGGSSSSAGGSSSSSTGGAAGAGGSSSSSGTM